MKVSRLVLIVLAFSLLLFAARVPATAQATTTQAQTANTTQALAPKVTTSHIQTVWIILMENHNWSRIDRSLIPMISAACHQVILLAIARKNTSCTFIARSTAGPRV